VKGLHTCDACMLGHSDGHAFPASFPDADDVVLFKGTALQAGSYQCGSTEVALFVFGTAGLHTSPCEHSMLAAIFGLEHQHMRDHGPPPSLAAPVERGSCQDAPAPKSVPALHVATIALQASDAMLAVPRRFTNNLFCPCRLGALDVRPASCASRVRLPECGVPLAHICPHPCCPVDPRDLPCYDWIRGLLINHVAHHVLSCACTSWRAYTRPARDVLVTSKVLRSSSVVCQDIRRM
jgi:hypothetical protein